MREDYTISSLHKLAHYQILILMFQLF